MKIIRLTIFAVAFVIELGQSQPTYKYDTEKVTNDIYVLKPRMSAYRWVTANIVVIVNKDDILVVDSGLLPEAAEAAIKEIKNISTKPVRYLLNTHWHGDHWQGNQAFAKEYHDLQIISAEQGAKAMRRNGMMWIKTFYPKYFQMMLDGYDTEINSGTRDGKPIPDTEISLIKTGRIEVQKDLESLRRINATFPNLTFSDKMILTSGDRTFEFHYLGVGNTIGDAILYLPEERVLIPGDLVVSPSPYESGAFSKDWIEVSKKLSKFQFDFLIPGHGQVQKNSDYLDYINALFDEISSAMNEAYLSGKTTPDEALTIVTTERIIDALNKNQKFQQFTKYLDPGFISTAVRRAYSGVIMGVY